MQQYGGVFLKQEEFTELALPIMMAVPAIQADYLSEKIIYGLLVFSEVTQAMAKLRNRRDIVSKTTNMTHSLAELVGEFKLRQTYTLSPDTRKEFIALCPQLVEFAATCTREQIRYGLNYVNTLLGAS